LFIGATILAIPAVLISSGAISGTMTVTMAATARFERRIG
jgi:hypothetical protein